MQDVVVSTGFDDQDDIDPLFDHVITVDEVRFACRRDMTFRQLFGGYATLRAITFSMETKFLDRLTELYDYSECIIGADFMARKNKTLHDALYYAVVGADISKGEVIKYPALCDRMMRGMVRIKAANIILDHRKRYILEGPAGTRVITASANMSGKAWTGDQAEYYFYDDSKDAYDIAMRDFDAAWNCCADIPYNAGAEKGGADAILDNPLVKNMIQANNVAIIPSFEPVERRQIIEYALLADERYEEFMKAMEPQMKAAKLENGHYVISYNNLKKASASLKASISKARRKIEVERITKNYPTMSFRYEPDDPGMFISGEAVDLAFDVDAVRADGVLLLNAFSHFTPGHEFIRDVNGLMDGHWRAMCFMFAAPHIGFLKHEAYIYNMEPISLPLYMLLGSKGPDTGKTFMMELLFSAMTGKHDVRFKRGSAKGVADSFIGDMRAVQAIHEGMPYVYDELLSSTIRSVRDLVKDFSAADAKEGTPVLIFTTNDLVDPDSLFRKRVVYIPFDAAIASGVDKNKFKSIGEQMKRGFTGAFYREFTRRYIPVVCNICNMMYDGHPDGWYPDVVAPASRIILDIFRDVGLQPFSGMRELAWNADYYADSKNAESAVRTISRMWESEPEQFCVQKDTVKIYFGTDSLGQKRAISLANMLPADVMARARSYRDEGAILTFDRAAAEDLGLVFRRGFFSRFRR